MFFRLVKAALALFTLAVLLLAAFIPAPLQEQAALARVPNPVKSAWFLLWIQELVSYSKYLINLVGLLAICFFLLPWLPCVRSADRASWMPPDQRCVNVFALLSFVAIVALTIVAMFFRGANWALQFPF